jgi:hypothetical protein
VFVLPRVQTSSRWSRCPTAPQICQLRGEAGSDEVRVVFVCGGQEVPHLLHAELFDMVTGRTSCDDLRIMCRMVSWWG